MSTIKQIVVNETTYDIEDSSARTRVGVVEENLEKCDVELKKYVDDKVITYTFVEDKVNHTLTITGTDGTSEVITLGGAVTKEAVIAGLGFTPADVEDVPTDLSDLSDDATHRLVTDDEKQAWNNKSDFDGNYDSLENKPTLFSGDYDDLNNKPTLFSGNYNDLSNKPSIPANLSELTSDATHRTVTDTEKSTWNNKVTKEAGKSLISDSEITRLASVDNYDDSVLNGKVFALENAGYITKAVSDLTNYYKKAETYTQEEVNALVSAIPKFSIKVVSSLPTTEISETTIYLLKTSTTETGNLYTEYIYTEGAWEKLGAQTVDLTDYVTTTAMNTELDKKVDKVSGKGLSTNDFTTAYKNAIDNLPTSYAPTNAQANVIETIKVNGTTSVITNKAVDITVPTTANDIGAMPNDVTHLSGDVPVTRKVNGKALSSDITLSASDVSALASTVTHLSGDVPTSRKVNGKALSSDITLSASDVSALASTVTHLSGDVPTSRTINGKKLTANITLSSSDVSAMSNTFIVNSATEPTTQSVGDLWMQEY